MNRKCLVAVALLAVLAVVFGLAGTVAPPLAESVSPQQGSSSLSSVAHFTNPPTYDSGWMNIRDKAGQYFNITHNLNTTEVFVYVTGKYLNVIGGESTWNKTYGGVNNDEAKANCVVRTSDGGYALAGYTNSFGAGNKDLWLVKTDGAGNMLWNRTFGGAGDDYAYSLVQTSDEGYVIAGSTTSYGAGGTDF